MFVSLLLWIPLLLLTEANYSQVGNFLLEGIVWWETAGETQIKIRSYLSLFLHASTEVHRN